MAFFSTNSMEKKFTTPHEGEQKKNLKKGEAL